MVQRHVVVLPIEGGGEEVHPLKKWLRDHPGEVDPGFDFVKGTSHQMRTALQKRGWDMQVTADQVRLMRPGTAGDLLAEEEEAEEEQEAGDAEQVAPYFGLEFQLRDFLAKNLDTIEVVPGKRLQLYDRGVEYPTEVGPIDILAVEKGNPAGGPFYVFELKRAKSPDSAIGQVARYMACIEDTVGKGVRSSASSSPARSARSCAMPSGGCRA